MSLGIAKTLEVISGVGEIVASAIAVSKNGVNLADLPRLMAMASQAVELISDARDAFPELKDIDGVESAKLGQASYVMVRKILTSIAA
mgnify:CR=1 FL=1